MEEQFFSVFQYRLLDLSTNTISSADSVLVVLPMPIK